MADLVPITETHPRSIGMKHMSNRLVTKVPLLRRILCATVVGLTIWCSVLLHRSEMRRSAMKTDLKEISHITYGLFNVDRWRIILSDIVSKKVRALEVTPENRAELKVQIEGLMYAMIAEVESVVETNNKKSGLKGMLRKAFLDLFVDIKVIKAGVPRYADQVLDYLNDPKNREELREMVLKQFNTLADRTVAQMDYALHDTILLRYGCTSKQQCIDLLSQRTEELGRGSRTYALILLAAALSLLALLLSRVRRIDTYDLLVLVALALCLLASGLSLPMIDIEAAISNFAFYLLGEHVAFEDQILFFQSKSILDVVHVLLSDGDPGLIAVGFLILLFSVLIPVSKLVMSLITAVRGRVPRGALPRFLVFKASKWSMADVMVVAIFMAYIGFSGIVSNQLEQLESYGSSVQLLTTNRSELQLGFYLFLGYCLVGLLLSVLLDRKLGAQGIAVNTPQADNGK